MESLLPATNRTIVELKLMNDSGDDDDEYSTNRTIVELKLIWDIDRTYNIFYQSYHSGIETILMSI